MQNETTISVNVTVKLSDSIETIEEKALELSRVAVLLKEIAEYKTHEAFLYGYNEAASVGSLDDL